MESKLEKIENGTNHQPNSSRIQSESESVLQPGDEGYTDPVAVEQQMVAEEQARMTAEPDQEELACMMIKLYTPRFDGIVDKLSNRQLKRVVKSLVAFPLGKEYNHKDKTEAEAFMIGQSLLDAKMVLVIKTYNDNKDIILEMAAKEALKNTVTEFGPQPEDQQTKEVTSG